MRAWKEENDVCSSLPLSVELLLSQSLLNLPGAKNMMIKLIKVLRNVFVVQTIVPTGVSQSIVVWDKFDICCAWCFGHENV